LPSRKGVHALRGTVPIPPEGRRSAETAGRAVRVLSDLNPALLPATGDHVILGGEDPLVRYVESRIYIYGGGGADQTCPINIVLTDSEMGGLSSLIAKD
jgi:hypothetical protein